MNSRRTQREYRPPLRFINSAPCLRPCVGRPIPPRPSSESPWYGNTRWPAIALTARLDSILAYARKVEGSEVRDNISAGKISRNEMRYFDHESCLENAGGNCLVRRSFLPHQCGRSGSFRCLRRMKSDQQQPPCDPDDAWTARCDQPAGNDRPVGSTDCEPTPSHAKMIWRGERAGAIILQQETAYGSGHGSIAG